VNDRCRNGCEIEGAVLDVVRFARSHPQLEARRWVRRDRCIEDRSVAERAAAVSIEQQQGFDDRFEG